MLVVYVCMDVYTRLYLHTINQQMPSLQPHVWLPIISPYSQQTPGACDGWCAACALRFAVAASAAGLAACVRYHASAAAARGCAWRAPAICTG